MRITRLFPLLAVTLLACLLLFLPAHAQSPVTDCSNDDELRADILVSHIITFTCGTATIALDTPIVIDKYIEIDGGNVITLTGMGVTHHFTVTAEAGVLHLRNIALIDGSAPISDSAAQPAGSIYNAGVLFLDNNVTLRNNRADAPGGAGAIYSSGYLEIAHSRIISNTGGASGAVTGDFETVIRATEIAANQGGTSGAILSRHALRLEDSTLKANRAITGSGAISLTGEVDFFSLGLVGTSTLDGNDGAACGAIFTGLRALRLDASTVSRNVSTQGGAICVEGAIPNGVTIQRSTLSGNYSRGPALQLTANATGGLLNTTVTSNTTSLDGAGGVSASVDSYLVGSNNIVANNGERNCDLHRGEDVIHGFARSVVGDASCLLHPFAETPLIIADPLLMPLADNGGPTHTHLPQPDSPAIDLPIDIYDCTPQDQRDVPRWYGTCDAGAVEVVQGNPFFLPVIQRAFGSYTLQTIVEYNSNSSLLHCTVSNSSRAWARPACSTQ